MEPDADVIDLPLGKHPTIKFKYAVRWDPTGKDSVTVYRVRERYEHHTLVELELKTGRTHQIRVHLSHLGYPIVGDDVYGGHHVTVRDVAGPAGTPERGPREWLITRQALHAALLGFTHPVTNESVEFQAPLPPDMRDLVTMLRTHGDVERLNIAGARVDVDAALGV
jgi:23S rRNA pseudouridine1911/1915/1917 synthase